MNQEDEIQNIVYNDKLLDKLLLKKLKSSRLHLKNNKSPQRIEIKLKPSYLNKIRKNLNETFALRAEKKAKAEKSTVKHNISTPEEKVNDLKEMTLEK